jgi:hypothetical protein
MVAQPAVARLAAIQRCKLNWQRPNCCLGGAAAQDLKYMFPTHPWLQTDDGRDAVRRVLTAFSVHNDSVGYCRRYCLPYRCLALPPCAPDSPAIC